MSTDAILTGLGLVIVLALGCQLVASWTRLPAIVLLLPAGFIAGAVTDDVHPSVLFGATFQPIVSLGVGFILFEAGLRMRLDEMQGGAHRVVRRLIAAGVVLTVGGVAVASDVVVGLAVGTVAAGALWLLLLRIQRGDPRGSVGAALMMVTAAVVVADVLREDSGFVAATAMGMILANQEQLDVSRVLEFQGMVVKLLVGILFVLISASVSPSTLDSLLAPGIALIAIMVLVIRPLVVLVATRGSPLTRNERVFMAWLAPRGIVAAATASAFGPTLAQTGVKGAGKILPIAFIAIFGTVAVYGLTAAPLARRLGLVGAGALVVLVVGGHKWARAVASALGAAGLGVRLWTGQKAEQDAARAEGLDARQARLGVDVSSREAELEEVTDALLVTPSDNFNALAAFELRQELGNDHVYRLAPGSDLLDLVPRYAEGRILFGHDLTFDELTRRFEEGATLVTAPADRRVTAARTLDASPKPLFVVSPTDGHTHVDALCHVAFDGALYNGRSEEEVSDEGARVNSIEVLKTGLVGRGVLLDIPRVRGVQWLEPGEHVFTEDLEAAERECGVTVDEGDILLVRTGHARRLVELGPWDTPTAKAGLHPSAMPFISERLVAALGSDGNNDTAPSTTEGVDFPIHVLAITAMGLHLLDYLQLDDLSETCERLGRWDFLFMAAPLVILGGTGSPLNPIAVF
jgi:NhaP-type Na+/H+ or K+/H+ antiporter/kynurenine formamidase